MDKILEKELTRIKLIEEEIDKTIKNAPEGRVRCTTCRGDFQYYQGKEYISKKKITYIKQIAQRDYCKSIMNSVKRLRINVENLLKIYKEREIEQLYCRLPAARRAVVNPLFKPVEEIIKEFESIQYNGKEFSDDDITEYYTSKGERVRSKSEKIIADELYRYGIPYKYEMPVEVEIRGRKVIFNADFSSLNKRTGKKIIIEHFGMMDNPTYCENAVQKIDIYAKNGYLLGDTLLIFYETLNNPLNTIVLQKYIETYLL